MIRHTGTGIAVVLCLLSLSGCAGYDDDGASPEMKVKLDKYTTFRLVADLSGLTDEQRKMVGVLIEAAEPMDEAFWLQAYGSKDELLGSLDDPAARRFAEINYGPWDRLDGDAPFLDGVEAKPEGARFYPPDMTKDEFEAAIAESDERRQALTSLYTMVERDAEGELTARPFSEAFSGQAEAAAAKLREAAELAQEPGLKKYLSMRADALLSDDYQPSDLAWMDMKDNTIDVVIGPIETYEDALFGYKAAYEAYVLIKDMDWSRRLSRYVAMLPELQRGLPVDAVYKAETPGVESDLNAYDVVYYAGHCNAGSKTIAINLPNDEEVQLAKGTRRLQLKNAMRAKFDKILVSIADELIAEDQRKHVTFEAFFANTMFHEVAHGLGIKNTLNGEGTVRDALKEQASAIEEGKADILGLYMVTKLHENGELGAEPLEDYYVTFMSSIFRSVRFGASSAHGRANMIRFNFFQEQGAFSKDEATGRYRADFDKMREAVDALSRKILELQGDGNHAGARELTEAMGVIGSELQSDLDRLAAAGIPVDIVLEQGKSVLGL
ncbi:MAG: Zn-dependent hydrolase [bacterium]|nr:Zn-dependent hydrolase [bacterium]